VIGVVYYTRNDSVGVGTTAVTIFEEAQPGELRMGFTLNNTSAGGQNITIVYGGDRQAAAAGFGDVLNPKGVKSEGTAYPDAPCFQGKVQAIADAAGGVLAVQMWAVPKAD
jgi:hypothetical protein